MAFHTAALHRTIWRHLADSNEPNFINKNDFFNLLNLIGSLPKFDTMLASWYPTYMQSFIISHSSCAEQYGDMSSDRLAHTHKKNNNIFFYLIGSPPKFDTLLASWYPTLSDIHAKFHNQPFIMRRAIW